MSKILIAVPTFETIYPDTYKSIWDVDRADHEVYFDFVRGYDCATARNNIIMKGQNYGVDYILMVDNDVTIPKDTITNFLELGEDTPYVQLGFYAHRDSDNIYRGNTCICRYLDDNGEPYFNYPLESEYTEDEMREFREQGMYKMQIHGGGMGCAFIKMDLIDQLRYPWYDWVNYNDDHRGMLSEDLYFCEQCKQAGVPIFTDTRIGCGHLLRHIQEVM